MQGQFGQAGSMLSANQIGTQMLPGTNRMRRMYDTDVKEKHINIYLMHIIPIFV